MEKKLSAVLLAVWLCLAFSGCSFTGLTGLDPKNLMEPPKSNADQQAIHKLLQDDQLDITFVYPQNGEYRSAIIMQDFTGDGVKDAVGFYALEDSGGVAVQFLVKSENEWYTEAVFQNTAIQVDRVCFGDLTGNGRNDIIIGWGSTAGTSGRTAAVSAYCFDEAGSLTEHFLGSYGEMAITDLDDNGACEVFTVDKFLPAEAEGDAPSPARAKLYRWQDGTMGLASYTDADNSISTYFSAVFGRLNAAVPGVVLDGAKADGSMTSQIFYMKNDVLYSAPFGVNTETYNNLSSRPGSAAFLCRDINDDGFLEIPSVSLLPSFSEDAVPDSTSYLVTWYSFQQDDSFHFVTQGMMNLTEGYWFSTLWSMEGQITAVNDPDCRTVTYYQVTISDENGSPLLGPQLFSIRAFSLSSWESLEKSAGYKQLAAQGDSVYGILLQTRDEHFQLAIDRVQSSFKLLS